MVPQLPFTCNISIELPWLLTVATGQHVLLRYSACWDVRLGFDRWRQSKLSCLLPACVSLRLSPLTGCPCSILAKCAELTLAPATIGQYWLLEMAQMAADGQSLCWGRPLI